MSIDYQRRLLGLRLRRCRHLHAVRARSADPVRLHRPAQFRPCRVHGDLRLHDGDPHRKEADVDVARRLRSASSQPPSPESLVGLPTLRLRADYFAIVTIAFGEIVRYVATNQDGLTGGSQGTIALGRDRQPPSTTANGCVSQLAGPAAALGISTKDVAMLARRLGGRPRPPRADRARVRTPWGRVLRAIRDDEDAAPRSARTSSATSSRPLARRRPRRPRRSLPCLAVLDLQPRRLPAALTFFALIIVILGGKAMSGPSRSARSPSASSSPARASSTSGRSRCSPPATAPSCGWCSSGSR